MKKIFLSVLFVLLYLFSFSQSETNIDKLTEFSEKNKIEYSKEKEKAISYARLNNIPISFYNEDSTYFELQKLDSSNNLYYYITNNYNSSATISTNNVLPGGSSGLELDGTGILLRLWDAGIPRLTHQEYNGRVTVGDGSGTNHYHSTHVAGTMIASGVDNNAKGMATNAELVSFNWSYDQSEMAIEASNGALISNHSYGYGRGWVYGAGWQWYGNPSISEDEDYLFGFYESQAQDWDQIAYDAPYYLIVKSAGNDRGDGPLSGQYPQDGPYDCIAHAGISKNVLTVGAVDDIPGGYSGPSSVIMSSFSSWGPADDGRIKPDIVANGISLYSTDSGNDTDYVTLSGTSMASPSVAGSLALLQELWNEQNGNYMKAATLKGLVINTADEAGNWDGPDYEYGWGLMNTEKAALKITEDLNYNVIDELVLVDGSSYTRTISSDGTEPLKITICWTDLPGTPVSNQLDPIDPMIVNDLDLKVTYASNIFYPWKMDRDNPTNAATNNSKNSVDNVETVYISNPVAGDYDIVIDHDGTLINNQLFSLIIDGAVSTIPSIPPVADFNADEIAPETMEIVHFYDLSNYNPSNWNWSFDPSTVSFINNTTFSSQNPVVIFDEDGTYDVTLTVSNEYGSDTEIKYGYVVVTDPVPFSLPWTEGFEGVGPITTFTENTTEINDLEYWSYEKTNNGRLRFEDYYRSGSNAATLDANPSGTFSVNYLIVSVSLFDYSDSENLELSFYYMNHGEESQPNDRVWIRGSDLDDWIEIYNLYSNKGTPGTWKYVSGIDIDQFLTDNGQIPTQTFQIKFGQEDNFPANSPTASDGVTFDDITIKEVDFSQYIISTFPYSQSWEDGIGVWFQDTDDDFDWTRMAGGTPSFGTGPNHAYDGSYYLYTEASSPQTFGDFANIFANFDFTNLTDAELSFYYHMAGTNVGSLHLDIYDGSMWNNDIWNVSGSQQSQSDLFINATVDLDQWEGMSDIKIRFRGIVGDGGGDTWSSDIAIDLIEVTGNTVAQPPFCTNPVNPSNGAIDVPLDDFISWDAVSNADGYYIYFGTNSPPTNIENGTDLGDVTNYTPTSLDYLTEYFWKVVPYNSIGDAVGCSVWNFTTVEEPPICTDPVYPTDNSVDIPTITIDLEWDAVSNADGYYLYIGTDNPPTNMENGVDLGDATVYSLDNLDYLTEYFWKVVPYNSSGNAVGCVVWNFTTEELVVPPNCTQPVTPLNNSTEVILNTNLEWDPVSDADGYYLYIGTDNPPTNMENGVDLGDVLTFNIDGNLEPGTSYYWKIVPYNVSGSAIGCNVWNFITIPLPSSINSINPQNNSTSVSVSTTLDWNSVQYASGYYLYLGTDNPPTNMENGINVGNSTTYNSVGLDYNREYFWKVVPYNQGGISIYTNDVWNFTTDYSPITSNYPYSESFENGFGGWIQSVDDDGDWTRNTNYTSSYLTGPSSALDNNYYIYTESSGVYQGSEFILYKEFDISSLNSPELIFGYHMFGTGIGSLHIDIYDGNWNYDVWSMYGNQNTSSESPFNIQSISLQGFNSNIIKIAIRSLRGNSFKGDVSVDFIKIQESLSGDNLNSVPIKNNDDTFKVWSYGKDVFIELKGDKYKNSIATIFDLTGRVVFKKDISNSDINKIRLNISGTYIVNIKSNNFNGNKKVMVN